MSAYEPVKKPVVGDLVAINTSIRSGQSWMFGKVSRKTQLTVDIRLYKQKSKNIYSHPGGYEDDVSPVWGILGETIKAWTDKEGYYSWKDQTIDACFLVYAFDSSVQYKNVGYF